MQGSGTLDVQQIINTIVQFPVAAIVIWLFFKLSDKHEKFVKDMQDDWQAFIEKLQEEGDKRDKGYQQALADFGGILKDHTRVLANVERERLIEKTGKGD